MISVAEGVGSEPLQRKAAGNSGWISLGKSPRWRWVAEECRLRHACTPDRALAQPAEFRARHLLLTPGRPALTRKSEDEGGKRARITAGIVYVV